MPKSYDDALFERYAQSVYISEVPHPEIEGKLLFLGEVTTAQGSGIAAYAQMDKEVVDYWPEYTAVLRAGVRLGLADQAMQLHLALEEEGL